MNPLIIDFESYYDSQITLSKLNYSEYITRTPEISLCTILYQGKLSTFTADNIASELQQLPWDNINCIGHNLLFDAGVLAFRYGITAKYYTDTLGLSRLKNFSLGKHSLKDLQTHYLPTMQSKQSEALPKGKLWKDLTNEQREKFIAYNRHDVLLTASLYEQLIQNVPQFELDLINTTIQTWVHPRILLDTTTAERYKQQEIDQLNTKIESLVLDKETIRSDAKFGAYLRTLGHTPPQQYKDDQLKDCYAKTNPNFVEFYAKNPHMQTLLDLKSEVNSNIKEKRTERLIKTANAHNGFIPVAYNYHGAITGRFSGSNKLNLQNLPRKGELRNLLLARPGYVLIAADSSQVEARILAWISDEQDVLTIFKNKGDIYCHMASIIYGRPINKKEHPEERFVGKCAVLGLGYGMSAIRFQQYCALNGRNYELTFCEQVVERFRDYRTKTTDFWKVCGNFLRSVITQRHAQPASSHHLTFHYQSVELPSKRRLHYHNIHWANDSFRYGCPPPPTAYIVHPLAPKQLVPVDTALPPTTPTKGQKGRKIYSTQLVENIVQAIARDVIAEQMLEIAKTYPIVLQTHDEIVVEAPKNQADQALQHLLTIMKTPPQWAPDLPIDAEGGYATSYGAVKKS